MEGKWRWKRINVIDVSQWETPQLARRDPSPIFSNHCIFIFFLFPSKSEFKRSYCCISQTHVNKWLPKKLHLQKYHVDLGKKKKKKNAIKLVRQNLFLFLAVVVRVKENKNNKSKSSRSTSPIAECILWTLHKVYFRVAFSDSSDLDTETTLSITRKKKILIV